MALNRSLLLVLAALAVLIIIVAAFVVFTTQQENNGSLTQISVGMEPNQVNLLMYIAENQSYFSNNGLNVTIKNYPSGAAAVNGMLNREVNIATATEFILVSHTLENDSIQTFGSIDRFEQIYVIGNKNSGIENISDLAGKKVGLSLQTASQFYLGRFLELNGMNISQVTLVNVPPAQMVEAVTNGTVEVAVTWQPYVGTIENQLGGNITIWNAQSNQAAYDCLLSTNNWISSHPDLIKQFLSALYQAEQFTTENPEQAKVILQNRLNLTATYVNTVWNQYQFYLTLDQSLLLAMQDEAQWLIINNLTNATSVPNFLNYVYLEGLTVVKPGGVTIIH